MKAKIKRGDNFSGVISYILSSPGAELICSHLSNSAFDLKSTAAIRPDIKKPVWHASLALPEGETISHEKWEKIIRDFMERMGFDSSYPFMAYIHKNTSHQHVHIVASRVSVSGSVFYGQFEAKKAIEITQQLEKDYGLIRTKGLEEKPSKKSLKKSEIEAALRTGEKPKRLVIQNCIDNIINELGDHLNMESFSKALYLSGIEVVYAENAGGIYGVSFKLDGVTFKGSQLGKRYSWASLKKVLGYDKDQAGNSESYGEYSRESSKDSYQSGLKDKRARKPEIANTRKTSERERQTGNIRKPSQVPMDSLHSGHSSVFGQPIDADPDSEIADPSSYCPK